MAGAEYYAHALMQMRWRDLERYIVPGKGSSRCGLDDQGHRVHFVQETKPAAGGHVA